MEHYGNSVVYSFSQNPPATYLSTSFIPVEALPGSPPSITTRRMLASVTRTSSRCWRILHQKRELCSVPANFATRWIASANSLPCDQPSMLNPPWPGCPTLFKRPIVFFIFHPPGFPVNSPFHHFRPDTPFKLFLSHPLSPCADAIRSCIRAPLVVPFFHSQTLLPPLGQHEFFFFNQVFLPYNGRRSS